MNPVILNSELLEQSIGSTVPGNGSKIYFRNYPQTLRDVLTYAIAAHYNTEYSVSQQGNAIVDATEAAAAFLVLSVDGQEKVKVPIYSMIASLNGGLVDKFQDLNINWDMSYIQINNAAVLEANDTFAFTVIYKPKR